jgi:hypothetical protein
MMLSGTKSHLLQRWEAFSRTVFGCLLRLFLGRMFHGGGESGTEELGLGVGALLTLLAMPGLLVSLLMFEKYGSLLRFLRGDGSYDPFTATIPDEYFFIVLSTTVTGAVALWRWDSIFLDRRDHANLVALPISLKTLFFANFAAVFVFSALFAIVVNAASFILYPIAVVGSQSSLPIFLRFVAGHAVAGIFASQFSFLAVFAVTGLLMAVLPARMLRSVSLVARFVLAVVFLALLATAFTVPDKWLTMSVVNAQKIATLPPISILGISRSVWLLGADPPSASMAKAALSDFALILLVAIVAFAGSFRRSFLRLPETIDAAPLPRVRVPFSPLAPLYRAIFRSPFQRACYQFVARTLLRSDAHLQVLSAFSALGLVAAAETVTSIRADKFFLIRQFPSSDFLSMPFILGYCVIIGIRAAFEIPASLNSNWVFKLWLPLDDRLPRSVARRIFLTFSLPWLAPACFFATQYFFGWRSALLHTAILMASTILLVEILLVHFRKIPHTCPYPEFQSNSGMILVAYLFGFVIFTDYLPSLEHWSLGVPFRVFSLIPLLAVALAALYVYRKQLLDMDKQLVFDSSSRSSF